MSPAPAVTSLFGPPPSRVRDFLGRYTFALLAVVVATGVRYFLGVKFGFTPPYPSFYLAVMIVALFAGRGPGLAATLFACLAADYFFLEPRGSFAIVAPGDKIALAMFAVSGVAISVLAEIVRRRNADLARSKSDLTRAQIVARMGSWYFDILKDALTWSDEAYWIFQVPLGTPLSLASFFERVHPEDSATTLQAWNAALAGAPFDLEHRILVDGQTRWVHQRAEVGFDASGMPRFATGTVQDITERKCAGERLRRLNRTLQSLSECTETLMKSTDECTMLQQVCDSVVQSGGYRMAWVGYAEQDEYRTVRSVAQAGFETGYLNTVNISWANVERGRGPVGTSIRTAKVVICNDAARDPDFAPWREEALQRYYRSLIALPLKSENVIFGALAIYSTEAGAFDIREQRLLEQLANDMTYAILALRARIERDRAEADLRKSKDDWERTFDAVPDMVMLLDAEYRVLRANKSVCSFVGQEASALLGKPCFEVIHKRTSPHPGCPFQKMLLTGVGQQAEIAEPRLDKIFDVTSTPVWDGQHLRGAVYIMRDITARKHAEAALEISRAQAVSSERLSALGMMAGNIAHEINNPLAIIHASASDLMELAESGYVPLDSLLRAGARIQQTADRISKLVKSLRQISRDGSADPVQRASVAEIVEHALELCKERFRVHSVRLETPMVDAALHVSCREVQIAQVLLNLLQNAFDAVADLPEDRWVRLEVTPSHPLNASREGTASQAADKGLSRHSERSLRSEDSLIAEADVAGSQNTRERDSGQQQSVVFAVIDSGPGVPSELRPRIMEPFFTTKPVGKGTGLGLSLSKAIVENHGGDLQLSQSDHHTCFSFSLPLSKEPEHAAEKRLSTRCG